MEMIRELSARYGVSLVLCTATQPALSSNDDFRGGLDGVREMMSTPLHLEPAFARVRERRLGTTTDVDIAELMLAQKQSLCVVNTKKHARLLFQALGEAEGRFHLSAAMCPAHRSRVLGSSADPAAGSIRRKLIDREPCRVVSTQLVEAGVDVDFPVVIRAMAGIDSIVQAAGRCNREGKISQGGQLYVFTPEEGRSARIFRQNVQIAELFSRVVKTESSIRRLSAPTSRSCTGSRIREAVSTAKESCLSSRPQGFQVTSLSRPLRGSTASYLINRFLS